MFRKADTSAAWAFIIATVLFFIGGLLTTVVPLDQVLAKLQQLTES